MFAFVLLVYPLLYRFPTEKHIEEVLLMEK